ncbi:Uncharacterized conserved protein [Ceraceosorus bombacis]|uniref:Fanconi-associated nuclease n=1 Tax=Ceraceosorus bombacis TaxID=401625 RepID=A0A0P1BRV0_9BASI|nr:Uncharacterized conserved protein [Ceraceosorus bombacis]
MEQVISDSSSFCLVDDQRPIKRSANDLQQPQLGELSKMAAGSASLFGDSKRMRTNTSDRSSPRGVGNDSKEPCRNVSDVADGDGGASQPASPPKPDLDRSASDLSSSSTSSSASSRRTGESMYPAILGEMIDAVLEKEEYLFSPLEVVMLREYQQLPSDPRYVFARLVQRRDVWQRPDRLRFEERDCGDLAGAIRKLCEPVFLQASQVSHSSAQPASQSNDSEKMGHYCLGVQEMDPDDVHASLELLTLEELKRLAKMMGSKRSSDTNTRAIAIATLLESRTQCTFSFGPSPKSGSATHSNKAAPIKGQTKLNFSPTKPVSATDSHMPAKRSSQMDVLKWHMSSIIGDCVRLAPLARSLIARLALVYYRATVQSEGSALTTAVLARSRRRVYPVYQHQRTAPLFASRQHLISMEKALKLEVTIDELIEWDGSKEAFAKGLNIFESVWQEWRECVEDAQRQNPDGVDRMTYHKMRCHPGWPLTRIVYKGAHLLGRFKLYEREEEVLRALLAQRAFRRGRRGDWYDRLALILAQYPADGDAKRGKMRALEVAVQGIEDSDTHLIYHDTLQRRITRLENQLNIPFSQKHDFSYAKLATCRDRVFEGTRLDAMASMEPKRGIFGSVMPSQRRTSGSAGGGKSFPKRSASNESLLSSHGDSLSGFQERAPLRKVIQVERAHVARKADTSGSPVGVNRKGIKRDASTSSPVDAEGTKKAERDESDVQDVSFASSRSSVGEVSSAGSTTSIERKSMSSIWRGLDSEPCRVEDLVLQHYSMQGYSGYHCEGSIISMLFTLLMWDVIFLPTPGAFETAYQSAPLDIGEDSFIVARAPQVRQRLHLIEERGGLDLMEEVHKRESQRKTWAIGCKWDTYPLEDLLQIAQCVGGKGLAVICQMMCEEYMTAGMPDLVVWNWKEKKVRFCEVKGPGDRLREKQKVWIDVLLRAGLDVEVSIVKEGITSNFSAGAKVQ